MKHPISRLKMQGFSLVELLVSLVIGLVVVGAVLISYVGSGQTGRLQSAYAEMNENAQIGLSILSRDLLLAGYAQPTGVTGIPPNQVFSRTYSGNAVFGCENGFVSPNTTGAVACNIGAGTPALEVVYEADLTNTVPTSGAVPSDCLGNQLRPVAGTLPGPPAIDYYHTYNRYYLATGATGRSELYCASRTQNAAGNPVPGQPLVDNVAAMKIWYGEANAASPRQIVRYVSATPGTGVTDWGRVISVRVCLLMRSSEPVLTPGEDTLTYLDCDSATQTSADRHAYRAYFATTTLRNKMTF